MNRFSRESAAPVRRRKPGAAAQLLLRRGEVKDESLDLFSAIRRSESPAISSSSVAAAAEEGELGRRSGVDDDLFYVDVGKSDYDWLLTPPGTPLFSSSEQSSSVRSTSATKPSKLSVSSPPEIGATARSGRTVSAASSSASSNCTSSTPLSTAKSSLLSRSSASVTSKQSPSPRQTTMRPISTPAPTRLPSPARIRHKPSPPSTPIMITRPRAPSTASSPRIVAPASRPNPRQSTPARSSSVGRSAGAPARAAVQPDAMSKIKTKPTERPQSTGKQRSATPASSNWGRIQENSTKKANPIETKRPSASNTAIRISAKPSSSSSPPVESNGFGRNISKKSLDVAVRHTDIRQGAGGIRGASLFPHSIRSTAAKSRPIPTANKVALPTTTTTTTTADNRSLDRAAFECGSSTNGRISGERTKTEASASGDSTTTTSTKSQERKFTATRVSELDLYGISTRYDTMLLKEDAGNLNWLRSVDDVSAESPTFHRFEPLPEPFGLV